MISTPKSPGSAKPAQRSTTTTRDVERGVGARLAAAFAEKYADRGYEPEPDAWEGPDAGGLRLLTPVTALAWFDFPGDVTRFRFPV